MSKAKLLPRLEAHTFEARALYCKAFLAIHGFLSDAENRKVTARLEKKYGKDSGLAAGQRAMLAAAFTKEGR